MRRVRVTEIDEQARRRAERARRVALFRYELIQEVINAGLSTRQRGALVRGLAQHRPGTGCRGHPGHGPDYHRRPGRHGQGAQPPHRQAARHPRRAHRPVEALAITPDGAQVVTGSEDGTARLWDSRTGEPVSILRHSRPVHAVAVTPDGTQIVTGAQDGTARVWDRHTEELIGTLIGHRGPVHAVADTPDCTQIVTGAQDGTARYGTATQTKAGPNPRPAHRRGAGAGRHPARCAHPEARRERRHADLEPRHRRAGHHTDRPHAAVSLLL